MHGSDRVPDPTFDYERACDVAKATFIKSKMALFSECTVECAQKLFDTADIVGEAIMIRSAVYTADPSNHLGWPQPDGGSRHANSIDRNRFG
jgi:hypothetical protein